MIRHFGLHIFWIGVIRRLVLLYFCWSCCFSVVLSQCMCFAEFAASYTCGDNDCDALPGNNDSVPTVSSSKIVLTGEFCKLTK